MQSMRCCTTTKCVVALLGSCMLAPAALAQERPFLPLETLTVSGTGGTATSSMTLVDGRVYYILAEGTYQHAWAGHLADAEWDQREPWGEWFENAYPAQGEAEHDLIINGVEVDWQGSTLANPDPVLDFITYAPHTFSADHTYWYRIVGNGTPLGLYIQDVQYGDNSGSLQATIYSTIPEIDGLMAYWSFDHMEEDIVPDDSGNGHTAQIFGGATPVLGVSGQGLESALWYDGVDGWVDVIDPTPFAFSNESLTISAWVQIQDLREDANRVYVAIGDSADATPSLMLGCSRGGGSGGDHEGRVIFDVRNDPARSHVRSKAVSADLPLQKWVHLVGVVDQASSSIRLYLNGELQGEDSLIDFSFPADRNRVIFGSYVVNEIHQRQYGPIDEIRIYNRALTDREIEMLYRSKDNVCFGDFNGDGEVNTLDVLSFLNAWTAGCP